MVDEYSEKNGFYTLLGAEENLRQAAIRFRNAYFIAIFACCREIFIQTIHTGGISRGKAIKKEKEHKIRSS